MPYAGNMARRSASILLSASWLHELGKAWWSVLCLAGHARERKDSNTILGSVQFGWQLCCSGPVRCGRDVDVVKQKPHTKWEFFVDSCMFQFFFESALMLNSPSHRYCLRVRAADSLARQRGERGIPEFSTVHCRNSTMSCSAGASEAGAGSAALAQFQMKIKTMHPCA